MLCRAAGVHAARHGGDTVARRAQVGLSQRRHGDLGTVRAGEPSPGSADESTMVMLSMQWMTTVLQDPVHAGGNRPWRRRLDGVGGSCKKNATLRIFFVGSLFKELSSKFL